MPVGELPPGGRAGNNLSGHPPGGRGGGYGREWWSESGSDQNSRVRGVGQEEGGGRCTIGFVKDDGVILQGP